MGWTQDRWFVGVFSLFTAMWTATRINFGRGEMFDPAMRFFIVEAPWRHLLHNVAFVELAPPGWHILAKVLVMFSPFSTAVTLRAVNLVLFTALVPIGYWLGLQLRDRLTGLVFAALLPMNSMLLNLVARGDHYILYTTLGLLTFSVAIWVLQFPSWPRMKKYTVVAFCFGVIHYYAFFLLAAIGLFGLWTTRHRSTQVRHWVYAHIPLAVTYLLWTPYLVTQLRSYQRGIGANGYDVFISLYPNFIPTAGLSPPGYLLESIFTVKGVPIEVFAIIFSAFTIISVFDAQKDKDRINALSILAVMFLLIIGKDILYAGYSSRHLAYLNVFIPLPCALAIGVLRQYTTGMGRQSMAILTAIALILTAAVVPFGVTFVRMEDNRQDAALMEYSRNVSAAVEENDTVGLVVIPAAEGLLYREDAQLSRVTALPKGGVSSDGRLVEPIHFDKTVPNNSATHQRIQANIANYERVVLFLAHGRGNRSRVVRQYLAANGFELEQRSIDGSNAVYYYTRSG